MILKQILQIYFLNNANLSLKKCQNSNKIPIFYSKYPFAWQKWWKYEVHNFSSSFIISEFVNPDVLILQWRKKRVFLFFSLCAKITFTHLLRNMNSDYFVYIILFFKSGVLNLFYYWRPQNLFKELNNCLTPNFLILKKWNNSFTMNQW